jgi:hypothetical protein
MYDFSTGEVTDITNDDLAAIQLNARTQGGRIVYQDLSLGNNDLMGDWNHSAVFLRDLVTDETIQVAGGEWIAAEPDVFGNIVIWNDSRACDNPNDKNDYSDVEIWGKNIDTDIEQQIFDLPDRPKTMPRIWGDKVFIHMFKADPSEDAIYMITLPGGFK